MTHFKDNFKTLADHQGDVEYWKEETLCRFLALPDHIRAGSVLYAMITYLGAFPFPGLAPCIVTREAMLKCVTILTGRYKKILRRGDQDKNKLLFRSLAVFDRRSSAALSPTSEKKMKDIIQEQQGDNSETLQTAATGFSIDQPANDDEDEDDDDLALAALDALDAIEVFKEDHKQDRKIHHAHIPVYNFERLLMLLLICAPLTPQDNIAQTCGAIEDRDIQALERSAAAIIAAFDPDHDSISYTNFLQTTTALFPQLFRPLSPLFEHFLFSKQLDLSKHHGVTGGPEIEDPQRRSPLYDVDQNSSPILTDSLLAQLSSSIEIATTTSAASSSFFHCGAKLNQLYSTTSHGTSLSSFSRQVLSWRSGSMLIVKGSNTETGHTHIIGAYLPERWNEAGSASVQESDPAAAKAVMFQLHPRHAIFRANPYNKTTPVSHFSSKTGIALGCVIPASSRINASSQKPILGPVSLLIDEDISTATFQHDGGAGTGAFLTDPLLEENQQKPAGQSKKIELEIDGLEVWGVNFPEAGGEDEITRQKKRLAWEEAEAARRRGVNFGGDKDGARHLLEMAGIVDSNRSGGSMG